MKRCPKCNSTYTNDSLSFCLDDGTPLVPSTYDSQAQTLNIHGVQEGYPIKQLKGEQQVYDEAVRLIALAERSIRTTGIGIRTPTSPPRIGDAFVDRLKKGLESGRTVTVYVVIGADSEYKITQDRKLRLEQRFHHYKDQGVMDFVHFFLAPALVGIDVLIIDGKHMIINLPYRSGVEGIKYGLLFYDSSDIVEEFVDWFDTLLLPNAREITSLDNVLLMEAASIPNNSASKGDNL